jgi:hypothetical protein
MFSVPLCTPPVEELTKVVVLALTRTPSGIVPVALTANPFHSCELGPLNPFGQSVVLAISAKSSVKFPADIKKGVCAKPLENPSNAKQTADSKPTFKLRNDVGRDGWNMVGRSISKV